MGIQARLFTDPACPASWGAEPSLRKLLVEFADQVELTFVMGGLARELHGDPGRLVSDWLAVADRTEMPLDPRVWYEGPIASTYPACMAIKAAAMQAGDRGARYLRTVREGLFCFRRKLDTTEALVEEARSAGLDVERFRIDLGSHATVEAFGSDLEETRANERETLPSLRLRGEGGEERWLSAERPYPEWREAALALGGRPGGDPPAVEEALTRFDRMATKEVELVCDLPGPRAAAELWRLAAEWRTKPIRVLTGHLWELA